MKRRGKKSSQDRRRYLRMRSGHSCGTCSAGEIALVDVSPMGLGFSIRNGGELSPGDRHLVIVEDPKGKTFEALGELRWRSEGPLRGGPYRAGFAFVSILCDDPEGRWVGVTSDPTTERGSRISWTDEIAAEDLPADETSPSVLSLSPAGSADPMPTEDHPEKLSLRDLRRIGR